MKIKGLILLALFSIATSQWSIAQCNGSQDLCDRRYDQVAYLTTHNAFNADSEGFLFPNQNFGVTRQLDDGVRGLMLDVYDVGGTPTVYHGTAFLGSEPLVNILNEIKTFLDANPNEIVTIIFECYVTANDIESAMSQAGLLPMLYEKPDTVAWATLQQMINSGKRLVVLSDENDAGAGQGWYHYVWDLAVETHFSNNDTADFSCAFNRGNAQNDLFILNHFITDATLGIGVPTQAAIANANPYFIDRINECWSATGKFPNFPTIDFHDIGDGKVAVDMLNSAFVRADEQLEREAVDIMLWPNPADQDIWLGMPEGLMGPFNWTLYSAQGELLAGGESRQRKIRIDLRELSPGFYYLQMRDGKGNRFKKKIIVR